jgi:peptidoglycan/LPS O-acetylase OafA/YrhL
MPPAAAAPRQAGSFVRIPELDGLRGVAAFGIVLWHYIPSIVVSEPGSLLAYLQRGLSLCWAGVDLFFVLSGFLIGSILLRESGSTHYFSTFYIRRAARILPLYFIMLAGLALGQIWLHAGAPAPIQPLFENTLPWWSYAVFAHNFFMPGIDSFGPKFINVTWSLAVEEQFYLLLPLLVWASPRRQLGWWLLALFLSAPLLRLWVHAGMATYVLLPFRLDSLMAGALLALAWGQQRWRDWIVRHPRWLMVAWIVLAVPAPFLVRSGAGLSVLGAESGWAINTWLAAWFVTTLALLLGRQTWFGGVFRLRPSQWMGRVAYGLYLLHPAVLCFVHWAVLGREPVLSDARTAAVTALAMGLSLLVAGAAYRWIEAPFLARGQRFKY